MGFDNPGTVTILGGIGFCLFAVVLQIVRGVNKRREKR